MSRRRPGISRSHGALGWMSPHLDVSAGPATVATVRPAPPAMVKVHHPAVKAPEWKCYRVIRLYRRSGQALTDFEDIGRFKTHGAALVCLNTEDGCARVLDPNGRVLADNFRQIETREA